MISPPSNNSERILRFLAIVAILVATVLIYAPRLHDFFLSDDFAYLQACRESPTFGGNSNWDDLMIGESGFLFRPFVGLTGWLTYQVAGIDPFIWHLADLAMHLLAVWLTILLVRRFVASPWAAIAAGAIFGLHYLNAETVVWISARTSLLVTVLMLSAVVLETAPRARLWGLQRWLALLLAALAHLSKEHAVALPVLLLLVPPEPLAIETARVARRGRGRVRAFGTAVLRRVMHFWPYVIMTTAFIVFRLNAIIASTHEQSYRLELHANVLKNLAFLCVSTLFPLDFRSALAAWNNWYLHGDYGALTEFILGSPGVIVGTLVAVLVWLAIFLWGHRAARRLALWVLVAALPVIFFRGTGERLIYASLPGAAGAIAITLAVWHRSFVAAFQRVGRWISPALVVLVVALNVGWLGDRLRDWESASDLSHTIVEALERIAPQIPAGATVGFTNLPDNINGAWVFRTSINHAFALYAGRPDVRTQAPTPASPGDWDAHVLVYRWNGEDFVPTADAAQGARTTPQSTGP